MKFHDRFNIEVGQEEARRRFVNRTHNKIFAQISENAALTTRAEIGRAFGHEIGEIYVNLEPLHTFVGADFFKNLQAIEGWYGYMQRAQGSTDTLDSMIQDLISRSEVDLGIGWVNGRFIRKGASLLDKWLVNDVLHWLRDVRYESVLTPFEKGLRYLLEAHTKKESLSDVVTDMYESVEALAKKITERDRDLSANRELFISKVRASEHYKMLLKDYIEYANYLRHAESEGRPKPQLSEREVESFVYLTGIFIRLAMPQAATATTNGN